MSRRVDKSSSSTSRRSSLLLEVDALPILEVGVTETGPRLRSKISTSGLEFLSSVRSLLELVGVKVIVEAWDVSLPIVTTEEEEED